MSGEQFYEVSSGLHDALASRAGAAFSLAQMFAGQLEGHEDDQHSGGSAVGQRGGLSLLLALAKCARRQPLEK